MIDKFSWSRVGLLMRRYFNENLRQLLMAIGVIFGIMFFFGLTFNNMVDDDYHFSDISAGMWVLFFIVVSVGITISASLTFSAMSTKPRRIVAMMVPASKLEKFITVVLIYNVFGAVAIILSAFMADALSSALFLRSPSFLSITKLIEEIPLDFEAIEIVSAVIVFLFANILCSQSIYTLGSAMWPKKSFIKTFCVMFAFQSILPIILPMSYIIHIFEWFSDIRKLTFNWHIWVWSFLTLYIIVDLLIFWVAWRRYRSTQLIQKFMMD